MTYLAVDYGTKRIGVAVSRFWLAEPVAVFSRDQAAKSIVELVKKEQVGSLLIGIADGKMADEARAFVQELQTAGVTIPVIEVDETLSSKDTHLRLARSGAMPKSRRQQPIDHFAAATFLQEYLDTHKEA